MSNDIFSTENEVKSNWMKWSKEGDFLTGTLVAKRVMKNVLRDGSPDQNVYEIKCSDGSFHEIDEKKKLIDKSIVINSGDFYNVGGKVGLDVQMRNVKIGQIIGIKFIEEVASKTKGYNPTKILKVFTAGEMDATVMEGVGQEVQGADFGEFPTK